MKVLGMKVVEEFRVRHADVGGQIDVWVAELRAASWSKPVELLGRYPRASILSDNRVVFRIKGNAYRAVVRIHYDLQLALIQELLTHAEYSKRNL